MTMPRNAITDIAEAAAYEPEEYEPPPLPFGVDSVVTMETLIGTVDAHGVETDGLIGRQFDIGLNQLSTYEPTHVLFPRDLSKYPRRALEILTRSNATAVASLQNGAGVMVQTGHREERIFNIVDRVAEYVHIGPKGLRFPTVKAAEIMRVYKQFVRAVPYSALRKG